MNERDAYIALNMMEGIGPVTVRHLVDTLGSVDRIFGADRSALMSARGVGPDTADRILAGRDNLGVDDELYKASAIGARIITPVDAEYPKLLREIPDGPLALYVAGQGSFGERPCIAVVGTRSATHYGRESAERIAYELAQIGFAVVSGLALGIDTGAHKGALKAGGETIAVIGSGLDKVYPSENRQLAEQIQAHGMLVSEFSLGREPDKTTFPIRNRIISGLSLGTVVVEAGRKSGAMITAHQAAEQGREIFAVPGRIDSYASRGPHQLIREGARILENAHDVLDELQYLISPRMLRAAGSVGTDDDSLSEQSFCALSSEERQLTGLLSEGPADIDELIRRSGLGASRVSTLLLGLEMKKVARILPGRVIELASRG